MNQSHQAYRWPDQAVQPFSGSADQWGAAHSASAIPQLHTVWLFVAHPVASTLVSMCMLHAMLCMHQETTEGPQDTKSKRVRHTCSCDIASKPHGRKISNIMSESMSMSMPICTHLAPQPACKQPSQHICHCAVAKNPPMAIACDTPMPNVGWKNTTPAPGLLGF